MKEAQKKQWGVYHRKINLITVLEYEMKVEKKWILRWFAKDTPCCALKGGMISNTKADLPWQASELNSPERHRTESIILSSREVWSYSSLQTLPLNPGQADGSSNFTRVSLHFDPHISILKWSNELTGTVRFARLLSRHSGTTFQWSGLYSW